MKTKAILFLVLFCVQSLFSQVDKNSLGSYGEITGTVFDSRFFTILTPQPEIVFDGPTRVVASLSTSGTYVVSLPPGLFSATVMVNGFYPIRRSKILVKRGERRTLNFQATPMYFTRGTSVSETDSGEVMAREPKYETLFTEKFGLNAIEPMIQFNEKYLIKDGVEFRWAVVTYGYISIYAERIRFRRSLNLYEYSGDDIRVDDGSKTYKVKRVKVTRKKDAVFVEYY